MPKVEAWQCAKTGQLFDEAGFRRHMAKKSAQRYFDAKRKALMARARYCLDDLHRQGSFEDIAAWIEDNAKLLFQVQILNNRIAFYRKDVPPKNFSISNIVFRNMVWSDECSNSHSAPIGERTNWERSHKYPISFPGYRGRIDFVMSDNQDCGGSNVFRETGINTGSGGGGGNSYSYEVTLFAADWPMLILNDNTFWVRSQSSKTKVFSGKISPLRKQPPQKRLLLARERV